MPGRNVSERQRAQTLKRLRGLSRLLDSSIQVPIIKYRIGLDPLIGLIPGLGDAITLVPAAYILYEAFRLGVPRSTLARMALNVGVEALVGAVPILGDLFDATFKANLRNLYLIERHTGQLGAESLPKPSNRGVLAFFVFMLVILSAGMVAVLWLGLWLVSQLIEVF